MNYATQPEIVGTESLAFIDQTLISVIEFRLRHLHAIKKTQEQPTRAISSRMVDSDAESDAESYCRC